MAGVEESKLAESGVEVSLNSKLSPVGQSMPSRTFAESEALASLMNSNVVQAHHHENQRGTLGTTFLTLISGGIAYAFTQNLELQTLPISIFAVIFGLFGAVLSMKFSQRFHLFYSRFKAIESFIVSKFEGTELKTFIEVHESKNKAKFGFFAGSEVFEIFHLWVGIFLLVSLVGLGMIVYTLIKTFA